MKLIQLISRTVGYVLQYVLLLILNNEYGHKNQQNEYKTTIATSHA